MQVALPLLDREVITNFTIGCLASGFLLCHVYCFMVRTHHLDLLSRLLVYHLATCFSGTVGTRTSRLQLLLIQRELRSSTPFSIITSIGGHQFLLNMLVNSTARFFYSHLVSSESHTSICCSHIVYSLLLCRDYMI